LTETFNALFTHGTFHRYTVQETLATKGERGGADLAATFAVVGHTEEPSRATLLGKLIIVTRKRAKILAGHRVVVANPGLTFVIQVAGLTKILVSLVAGLYRHRINFEGAKGEFLTGQIFATKTLGAVHLGLTYFGAVLLESCGILVAIVPFETVVSGLARGAVAAIPFTGSEHGEAEVVLEPEADLIAEVARTAAFRVVLTTWVGAEGGPSLVLYAATIGRALLIFLAEVTEDCRPARLCFTLFLTEQHFRAAIIRFTTKRAKRVLISRALGDALKAPLGAIAIPQTEVQVARRQADVWLLRSSVIGLTALVDLTSGDVRNLDLYITTSHGIFNHPIRTGAREEGGQ